MNKDLPLKCWFNISKNHLKFIWEIFEYLSKYKGLEARFELFKEAAVVHFFSVILKLLSIVFFDSAKNISGKEYILQHSIQLDKPQINQFLLFSVLIFHFESRYQVLESANHIPEEANSYHFNHHLVLEFNGGQTNNLSVSNRGEGCNHPVEGGDVQWLKIILLDSFFLCANDPPLRLILFLIHSDKHPKISQQMRNKHNLNHKFEGTYQFFNLFDI